MKAFPISRVVPQYCGMAERLRRQRRLLVYRAFFDESGLDPKLNKGLIMGGFLGSVEEWERASDAWDACLHASPSIEYFKDSEYKSLDGEFLQFNRTTADAKILALAQTLSRFELLGFCATVSYTWFMYRDAKASRGLLGSRVYDWGFLTATSGVLQYLDTKYPGSDTVDFIFDDRTELRACINIYNQTKANPFFASTMMRRAGECVPGDDKQIAALQMADLLAGESCVYMDTKVKSDAFVIIRDNNKIVHVPCMPPRQFPNTLRLHKMARGVHAEAVEFLRRAKKQAPDRFKSVEEVEQYVNDLGMHEAYFQLEWDWHLSQLATDSEYQRFMKNYLAGVSDEEKKDEFRRFDETMRELMSVPHSEIKAALDAEKAEKQKKKRKAKKPSA